MTPDDAKTLTLGDPVRFTGYLVRISHWPDKVWQLVDLAGEGVVVGRRSYSNGHNERPAPEEPLIYHVDERFPVVLVAFALHRAVVAVPPDRLERDGGIWKLPTRVGPVYEGDTALFSLDDFH